MIKKFLKHPVYWLRVCVAEPVMTAGFLIEDLASVIQRTANALQKAAIKIEGDLPKDLE